MFDLVDVCLSYLTGLLKKWFQSIDSNLKDKNHMAQVNAL